MADDNDGLYEYSVISDPDTRLIEIQPSPSLETPVRCTLRHKTLAEIDYDIFAHYIALSYLLWNLPSDTFATRLES
ncbi:hypothetical protein BKA61DRAFT_671468 [Leptodontidium sp. MPI-SDFR-AT-0119]|nr:hypothetical protein BKA61DRAFT_671468 [Leptodontidium sp. MPI-SDFR-AT-0119]